MDQPERTVTLSALIELVAYAGAAAAFVATLIAVERAGGLGQTGDLLVALAITAFLVGRGTGHPRSPRPTRFGACTASCGSQRRSRGLRR